MPAAIMADHAHFQYNQFVHGLVLWAVWFVFNEYYELAVIAMTLAVNFKQPALYFAFPFAAVTLGKILSNARDITSAYQATMRVFNLLVAFLVVNVIIWLPVLFPPKDDFGEPIGSFETQFNLVIARILPLRRAIFESKVATFWCVLHNFVKVNYWEGGMQFQLTTGATLLLSLPALIYTLRKPTNRMFLLCLFNVSLTFFLFAMQVHEK